MHRGSASGNKYPDQGSEDTSALGLDEPEIVAPTLVYSVCRLPALLPELQLPLFQLKDRHGISLLFDSSPEIKVSSSLDVFRLLQRSFKDVLQVTCLDDCALVIFFSACVRAFARACV